MYVGSICSLRLGLQWYGNFKRKLKKKSVVLGSHATVIYVTL